MLSVTLPKDLLHLLNLVEQLIVFPLLYKLFKVINLLIQKLPQLLQGHSIASLKTALFVTYFLDR